MAKRIPLKDRPALTRDPADWARDHGWLSRRQVETLKRKRPQFTAQELSMMGFLLSAAIEDMDDGRDVATVRRCLKKLRAAGASDYDSRVAAMQEP